MDLGHDLHDEELLALIVWGVAALQFGFTGLCFLIVWARGGFRGDPERAEAEEAERAKDRSAPSR